MKADDWEFEKIIPDVEDCKASAKSCHKYMNLPNIGGNAAEKEIGAFNSGFMRGLSWAKAKYNIKE